MSVDCARASSITLGCRLGGLFFWRGGETAGGHVNMFFFCQVGDYTYQLASVKKGHAVRVCGLR